MQNRQHLEAQKLVMLSQQLWPPHDTPHSITSFQQTQTFLHLIADPDRGLAPFLDLVDEPEGRAELHFALVRVGGIKCNNVWVWKILKLVMYVLHEP